jgi:hypothetical protein
VLVGRIPQRRAVTAAVAAVLSLAGSAVGMIPASEAVADRAIDAPAVLATGTGVHPVWRLDRMAGDPLDVLVARGLSLPEAEGRILIRHAERTADRVAPFDWRAHGVTLSIGCHPVEALPCPLGVAIPTGATTHIVLSPLIAYLTDGALQTVIAHELAHVWQFSLMSARRPGSALVGIDVEQPEGVESAELEADCLAAAWGFGPPDGAEPGYWQCPVLARIATAAAWRAAPLD